MKWIGEVGLSQKKLKSLNWNKMVGTRCALCPPYATIDRIARLERENTELLQQFVVWQYNARIHGVTDMQLNKALPGIDRGQTD